MGDNFDMDSDIDGLYTQMGEFARGNKEDWYFLFATIEKIKL